MDKTKLGVVAAITTLAIPAVAPAQTFADLLEPIPNASAQLQQAEMRGPAPQLIQAQYVNDHHHHHQVVTHHHHHHYYRHYRRVVRRIVRQHHHHHHQVVTHDHHHHY